MSVFIIKINENKIEKTKSTVEEVSYIINKNRYCFCSWFNKTSELKEYLNTDMKKKKKYLITKGYKRAGEYDVWFK